MLGPFKNREQTHGALSFVLSRAPSFVLSGLSRTSEGGKLPWAASHGLRGTNKRRDRQWLRYWHTKSTAKEQISMCVSQKPIWILVTREGTQATLQYLQQIFLTGIPTLTYREIWWESWQSLDTEFARHTQNSRCISRPTFSQIHFLQTPEVLFTHVHSNRVKTRHVELRPAAIQYSYTNNRDFITLKIRVYNEWKIQNNSNIATESLKQVFVFFFRQNLLVIAYHFH